MRVDAEAIARHLRVVGRLEDEVGAPIPAELQPGAAAYDVIAEFIASLSMRDVNEWPLRAADDLAVRLAPLLRERAVATDGPVPPTRPSPSVAERRG